MKAKTTAYFVLPRESHGHPLWACWVSVENIHCYSWLCLCNGYAPSRGCNCKVWSVQRMPMTSRTDPLRYHRIYITSVTGRDWGLMMALEISRRAQSCQLYLMWSGHPHGPKLKTCLPWNGEPTSKDCLGEHPHCLGDLSLQVGPIHWIRFDWVFNYPHLSSLHI